jgi:hypothetical protein
MHALLDGGNTSRMLWGSRSLYGAVKPRGGGGGFGRSRTAVDGLGVIFRRQVTSIW